MKTKSIILIVVIAVVAFLAIGGTAYYLATLTPPPSPTPKPTSTFTPSPSPSPISTVTPSQTPIATPTAAFTPSPSPMPTTTATPASTPTPKPPSTPTPKPTPIPTPLHLFKNVTVYFIDVGQGDSVFIDTPTLDMLIDGGPREAGDIVLGYLRHLNVTRIDFVVATHPHEDHIGGLVTVLTAYNTTQIPLVIDSGFTTATKTYEEYIDLAKQRTVVHASRGQVFMLDVNVNVTVLNPTSPLEFEGANDNSIVLKMQALNVTFLFTGDSEEASEASILAAGFNLTSTVLKVGHHGSRTSTSPAYLEAVNPEVAVISVGEENRYGHPHQETLERLAAKGVTVYRTDLDGTVIITTDGVNYSVKTEKPSPIPTPTLTPSSTTPSPTSTPFSTSSPASSNVVIAHVHYDTTGNDNDNLNDEYVIRMKEA